MSLCHGAPVRPACRSLAALALALALVTGGCSKKPMMRLHHAEVSGVKLGLPPGVLMTAVVDVFNPNGYDVSIRAVRGQVIFSEAHKIPVDFHAPREGVWLAADATTRIRVPVTVPVDLALQLVRESLTQPTIPYRLRARAHVIATRSLQIEKHNYEVDALGALTRQQMEDAVRGLFSPARPAP